MAKEQETTMTAMRKPGAYAILRSLHLYLSLALGLFVVAIAITGAPLVWRDNVDRFIDPARYSVTGAETRLTVAEYAARARAAAGTDFGVVELRLPDAPGWPVKASLRAAPRDGGAARSIVATLDPPTGKVLGLVGVSSTFVGVLHNFHHMLMVPQFSGRQIVGWIGVVLVFLSLSGLYLWWPRNAGFLRGLRWRRSPWTTTNLHQFAGFWVSIPLAIVAMTGAYLAFPNVAYLLMSNLAPMNQPLRHGGYSALPAERTALDADRALEKALALVPGAHPRSIAFPVAQRPARDHAHAGHGGGEWRIRAQLETGEDVVVAVEDGGGAAQRVPSPEAGDRAAALIKGLHEARRGGPVWALVVFLTGVAPAVFFFTGLVMWLRRRRATVLKAAPRRGPEVSPSKVAATARRL